MTLLEISCYTAKGISCQPNSELFIFSPPKSAFSPRCGSHSHTVLTDHFLD